MQNKLDSAKMAIQCTPIYTCTPENAILRVGACMFAYLCTFIRENDLFLPCGCLGVHIGVHRDSQCTPMYTWMLNVHLVTNVTYDECHLYIFNT